MTGTGPLSSLLTNRRRGKARLFMTLARDNLTDSSSAPLPMPAFLRLAGRPALLVGGGAVATAKFPALAAAGAQVTIVAPVVSAGLRDVVAAYPTTVVHERPFVPSDLDGAWYVVSAAPHDVNAAVVAAAEPLRLFVNAVDDTSAATAFAGAVVRRGPVTVAISTGGGAPALAGLLREALDALLPDDLAQWVATSRALRPTWKAAGVPLADRRPLLLQALNQLYGEGA